MSVWVRILCKMREIVLIIHNVRSAHNVGSLLRTAEGLGVKEVIISGYSPYPAAESDKRLPHIAAKTSRAISKTSLGAENTINWHHTDDLITSVSELHGDGFLIAALEQTGRSIELNGFESPQKIALMVGNEISGIDDLALRLADTHLEIPMLGRKESFNVSVAGAMALYYLRFL